MQATGGLPDPMPAYSIPFVAYALGYSLWIIIAGIVVYDRIKKRVLLARARRREPVTPLDQPAK